MDFSVRNVGTFKELTLREDKTQIESGLLYTWEAEELAKNLRETADELTDDNQTSVFAAVKNFLDSYTGLPCGAGEEEFFSHYEDIKEFIEALRVEMRG